IHAVSHAHCLAVVRCHFVAVLPSRAAFCFGLRLSLAGSPMHQAVSSSSFLNYGLAFLFPLVAPTRLQADWSLSFFNYGLVLPFRLLPPPALGDAVAFSYGQPVF